VLCKVGEPDGRPAGLPVTVTVSFGASAGVSGGMGKKEDAKVSGSVELKASTDTSRASRTTSRRPSLAAYTKALAPASKGTMVSAPQKELAAIAVGAQGRWEVARQMWDSGRQVHLEEGHRRPARSRRLDRGRADRHGGGAVQGKAYGVGGGYGRPTPARARRR
jgi:hypothetical protein